MSTSNEARTKIFEIFQQGAAGSKFARKRSKDQKTHTDDGVSTLWDFFSGELKRLSRLTVAKSDSILHLGSG